MGPLWFYLCGFSMSKAHLPWWQKLRDAKKVAFRSSDHVVCIPSDCPAEYLSFNFSVTSAFRSFCSLFHEIHQESRPSTSQIHVKCTGIKQICSNSSFHWDRFLLYPATCSVNLYLLLLHQVLLPLSSHTLSYTHLLCMLRKPTHSKQTYIISQIRWLHKFLTKI